MKNAKNNLITLAFIIALLVVLNPDAWAQRETRDLPSFTKISLSVPADVYLTQGNTQKVEVEGDNEDLEDLVTKVEGGKLIIKSDRNGGWFGNWDDWDDMSIYITIPNIEAISVAGSGSVKGQNRITAEKIDLSIAGSGDIEMEIGAEEVEAEITGSGDIELSLDADLLECKITGSGDMEIEGAGKTLDIKITGSGDIDASRYEAAECYIGITGSGSSYVNVSEKLDAKISGSGDVKYKGDPAHVHSHSSGSGHTEKM